ncbi:MAG: DUF3098 domain-containing protein [Bacteroidaceae bacterium]|nr:DUF3098 domain-containing protein [Bacteroidaceae bacterium]
MKKINYIVLVAGALIMLLGYFLMAGNGSDENQFNPEIFSDMRIKVAPIVCVLGFLVMGAGIMIKSKKAE